MFGTMQCGSIDTRGKFNNGEFPKDKQACNKVSRRASFSDRVDVITANPLAEGCWLCAVAMLQHPFIIGSAYVLSCAVTSSQPVLHAGILLPAMRSWFCA